MNSKNHMSLKGGFVLLAVLVCSGASAYRVPVQAFSNPSSLGTEFGNGQTDQGGFELGNGFINEQGMYQMNEVIGNWEINYFNSFTELAAVSPIHGPRTRVNIDVLRMPEINTLEDLKAWGRLSNRTAITVGNLSGVVKEVPSASGVRQIEYRLFRARGEIIQIVVTGSADVMAVQNFQQSLNSFESLQKQ